MKNILTLACLVFFAAGSYGQNCKYNTDKTDPITGKRTLNARLKINYYFEIGFTRVGDACTLECLVSMPGDQRNILAAGTALDLKLSNGKVITATSVEDASPIAYVTNAQVYSAYALSYTITPQQAKEIATAGIQYSKAHLMQQNYYEHNYKEGETEKSRLRASCVYLGSAPAAKPLTPGASLSSTPSATDDSRVDDYKEGESIIEQMQRKKKAKEEAAKAPATTPAPAATAPATPPVTTTPESKPTPPAATTPAPKPTTTTTAPVIVSPLSPADELMKWKKLLDDGVITREEFDVQKKKILEGK